MKAATLKRRLKKILPYKSWVMVLDEDSFCIWIGWLTDDDTGRIYTRREVEALIAASS